MRRAFVILNVIMWAWAVMVWGWAAGWWGLVPGAVWVMDNSRYGSKRDVPAFLIEAYRDDVRGDQ